VANEGAGWLRGRWVASDGHGGLGYEGDGWIMKELGGLRETGG
jgi:hypothetical protein